MALLFAPHSLTQVRIDHIGRDRAPVLVIDQFCAHPDELIQAAGPAFTDARRRRAGFPGVVAAADQAFAQSAVGYLMPLLCKVFGVSGKVVAGGFDFQLMTSPPELLSPRQTRPHIDVADLNVIASVLFLCRPPYCGTAFYRHNESGFEVITPDRAKSYEEAQILLDAQPSPGAYMNGDTPHFAEIARYEVEFNRLIFFSAASLHSGIASGDHGFSNDPRSGRLTANLFLKFAG